MAMITGFTVARKIPGPEQYGNRTASVNVILEEGDIPVEAMVDSTKVLRAFLNGEDEYPDLGNKAVAHYIHVSDARKGIVKDEFTEQSGKRVNKTPEEDD